MTKKAYVTHIRSELENNWLVKHKRFHIKKSTTRQRITCPKQRHRRRNSERICFCVLPQKLGKLLFIRNCTCFASKSALKTKEQNWKKAFHCLYCWVWINISFWRLLCLDVKTLKVRKLAKIETNVTGRKFAVLGEKRHSYSQNNVWDFFLPRCEFKLFWK